jgi:hypothetical protein
MDEKANVRIADTCAGQSHPLETLHDVRSLELARNNLDGAAEARAVLSPRFHEQPALVEKIRPQISALYLRTDGVS